MWALGDDRAHDRYLQAALAYKKERRYHEAAGIYEHLHYCLPSNEEYLYRLIEVYQSLSDHAGQIQVIKKLYAMQVKQGDIVQACALIDQLMRLEYTDAVFLGEHALFLIEKVPAQKERIMRYLEVVLKLLIEQKAPALQNFLLMLEQKNAAYHKQAQNYLRD